MDELIRYIWTLRNEKGIPITFRRSWPEKWNGEAAWYIWYGYTGIASRVNLAQAEQAVDVAVIVHNVIHESRVKAA